MPDRLEAPPPVSLVLTTFVPSELAAVVAKLILYEFLMGVQLGLHDIKSILDGDTRLLTGWGNILKRHRFPYHLPLRALIDVLKVCMAHLLNGRKKA